MRRHLLMKKKFFRRCFLHGFATSAVVAVLLISTQVLAASVNEQQYGYSYGDTVNSVQSDEFVICQGCRSDRLAKAPQRPFVAIKLNPPDPPATGYPGEVQQASGAKASKSGDDGERILGVVKFSFDSDKIKQGEKKSLKRLAATIPTGRKVTVTGYTCDIGTSRYNKKLSRRRAQHVADFLKKEGAQVAEVEGRGASDPVSSDRRENRRVQVSGKSKGENP